MACGAQTVVVFPSMFVSLPFFLAPEFRGIGARDPPQGRQAAQNHYEQKNRTIIVAKGALIIRVWFWSISYKEFLQEPEGMNGSSEF